MIGIGYSIIVRYSQYRVNISAIIFLSIYTIIQSPKISLNDNYYIYVYDIYCLILTSIFLIITNLLDKNIFKLFYIDALKN
ncbi:putative membrane protein [[Clostridium] sordellii ATCC 9714]|nr:putative membrane protein [[Clostridium] sordellii ATCC 9714] [Paeniclostridium sordellii ATCC 9714]